MTGQPDENEGEAEEGLPGETSDVAGETYRWDLLRGSMQGFVEACMVTFGLLVAIRVFDAPDMLKAILPGSYSGGLLISPLTIIIASRWGWTAGRTCALYSLLGGLSMIGAVSVRALPAFLVFIVLVAVFLAQTVPLLTKIYASNYAERERGSRYSTSVLFSAVIAAGFSYGGGLLLDLDIEFYRFVFLVPAFALFVNILAFNRMPAVAIHPEQSKNPVSDFKKAIRNRVFCMILVGWMFQGFGQVMTMPIRVEYLANERYGINATNEQIALIIGVVPFLTYLLSTKFWGYCFDRWNFIVLRVIMNVIAMVSIFTVFFTSSLWMIALGMGLYGILVSGGRILWMLWVVQLAPPDQLSTYTGIHTFFTGVRGALAPFVAYLLVGQSDPKLVGWIAAAIITIGICIMLPYRGKFQRSFGDEQNHE